MNKTVYGWLINNKSSLFTERTFYIVLPNTEEYVKLKQIGMA